MGGGRLVGEVEFELVGLSFFAGYLVWGNRLVGKWKVGWGGFCVDLVGRRGCYRGEGREEKGREKEVGR